MGIAKSTRPYLTNTEHRKAEKERLKNGVSGAKPKTIIFIKAFIIGGEIYGPADENNNFVEVLDIKNGSVSTVSNKLYPFSNGGLYFACLAALPEENSFIITGGEQYRRAG